MTFMNMFTHKAKLVLYLVFGRKLHFRRCVKKNNRSFTPVNLTIIFFNMPRN